MAIKGLRYPVFAPIQTETDGQPIVYGTGHVLCAAISAEVTENRRDNPLYGDDVRCENDKGMSDYTVTFEGDDISMENKQILFGFRKDGTKYIESGKSTPYVGFGYVIVKQKGGVESYEGYWYYKVQFAPSGNSAQTMKENIEWQTEKLNGTGMLVYNDASGEPNMCEMEIFQNAELAKQWLNTHANIGA